MSTPTNRVRMCAHIMDLDYEYISIDLKEGEQQSEEFLKINPLGMVPVMDDDGFVLSESSAIIRYICGKTKSNLYPGELKKRAVIDHWVDVFSQGLAPGISKLMVNKILAPFFGNEPNLTEINSGYEIIGKYLPYVENQLNQAPYLVGDSLSIADVYLFNLIDPSELLEIDLSSYSNIFERRENFRSQDFYKKVHNFYGETVKLI